MASIVPAPLARIKMKESAYLQVLRVMESRGKIDSVRGTALDPAPVILDF